MLSNLREVLRVSWQASSGVLVVEARTRNTIQRSLIWHESHIKEWNVLNL